MSSFKSSLAIFTKIITKAIFTSFHFLQHILFKLNQIKKMEFAELIKTPKLEKVILYQPFCEPIECALCITSHQLIASSRKTDHDELWVSHSINLKSLYLFIQILASSFYG